MTARSVSLVSNVSKIDFNNQDPQTDSKLAQMPDDLLRYLFFSVISFKDAAKMPRVCKRFYEIINKHPNFSKLVGNSVNFLNSSKKNSTEPMPRVSIPHDYRLIVFKEIFHHRRFKKNLKVAEEEAKVIIQKLVSNSSLEQVRWKTFDASRNKLKHFLRQSYAKIMGLIELEINFLQSFKDHGSLKKELASLQIKKTDNSQQTLEVLELLRKLSEDTFKELTTANIQLETICSSAEKSTDDFQLMHKFMIGAVNFAGSCLVQIVDENKTGRWNQAFDILKQDSQKNPREITSKEFSRAIQIIGAFATYITSSILPITKAIDDLLKNELSKDFNLYPISIDTISKISQIIHTHAAIFPEDPFSIEEHPNAEQHLASALNPPNIEIETKAIDFNNISYALIEAGLLDSQKRVVPQGITYSLETNKNILWVQDIRLDNSLKIGETYSIRIAINGESIDTNSFTILA